MSKIKITEEQFQELRRNTIDLCDPEYGNEVQYITKTYTGEFFAFRGVVKPDDMRGLLDEGICVEQLYVKEQDPHYSPFGIRLDMNEYGVTWLIRWT